jgi:hypothetical protein
LDIAGGYLEEVLNFLISHFIKEVFQCAQVEVDSVCVLLYHVTLHCVVLAVSGELSVEVLEVASVCFVLVLDEVA